MYYDECNLKICACAHFPTESHCLFVNSLTNMDQSLSASPPLQAGLDQLKRVWPEWPITGINVAHPVLHLKSMSSMCGIDTIAISSSDAGKKAWREIESNAHFKNYKCVVFPDDNGANCLFINGTVLHPPESEYPDSYKVWQTVDLPRVELPNSELAKTDGSLTCNSIRIQ